MTTPKTSSPSRGASAGARELAREMSLADLLAGNPHTDGKVRAEAAALIDVELREVMEALEWFAQTALRKDIVQARKCHVQPCGCGYCGLLSLLARWRVKG